MAHHKCIMNRMLSSEAYDCQKVVRWLIFVIIAREDWVIIKHTLPSFIFI